MSRIGKKPIIIPKGVTVTSAQNNVTIQGSRGALSFTLPKGVDVAHDNDFLTVTSREQTHRSRALWGTSRAILANMVMGVTKGFEKRLEVEGVGYRVALEGNTLVFALGFSHPVRFEAPDGIQFQTEKNAIVVSGNSKELVGRAASAIRELKPPEPYKGKGIHYTGEIIRRKAGKKAASAA
jgi:large subunit ribosomal protein L6